MTAALTPPALADSSDMGERMVVSEPILDLVSGATPAENARMRNEPVGLLPAALSAGLGESDVAAPRQDVARAAEVMFVDPGVDDIATLLRGVRPEVEPIVLDSQRPAARQMAEALAGRSALEAVHVVAHGAPGRVVFAGGDWTAQATAAQADDLAAIGRAIAEGGGLRLWSCHAGAGAEGGALVAGLMAAAGTAVGAAAGLVGAAALGGRWELAACCRAGTRAPLTAVGVAGYGGVLAIEITISGSIPSGPTTRNITYFVLDTSRNAVVGNITLPDASTFAAAFRLNISVPQPSERFDVGHFDNAGTFVSAGFRIEVPKSPSGAVGARG